MSLLENGRILYICPVDISQPTGPGVNEREFAYALHELLGDRVWMMLPTPQHALGEFKPYQSIALTCGEITQPGPFLKQQKEIPAKALDVINRHQIDLVVARPALWPTGLNKLVDSTKVPVVLRHVVGRPEAWTEFQSGWKKIVGSMVKGFTSDSYRRLVKKSFAIDTVTPEHAKGIIEYLGAPKERVLVEGNATNTTRFSPRPSGPARAQLKVDHLDPILGYIGGRPWERGGIQLVKAVADLKEKYPKIGAVIVGGGGGMTQITALAEEFGVADRIVTPGQVAYDLAPVYVNTFDVGVAFDLPDRSGVTGNSYQKVRQYLASGVPVVTTNFAADFIVENGLGSAVDSENRAEVARAIESWLNADRDAFATKASAYAKENLSVASTVIRRLEFWDQLLREGPWTPRS